MQQYTDTQTGAKEMVMDMLGIENDYISAVYPEMPGVWNIDLHGVSARPAIVAHPGSNGLELCDEAEQYLEIE